MQRQVVVRLEAEREVVEAARWYDDRVIGLGKRLFAEFEAVIDLLRDNPLSGPIHRGMIRKVRLRKFPYAAFYMVSGDEVSVIGFIHLHRNPKTIWQSLRRR